MEKIGRNLLGFFYFFGSKVLEEIAIVPNVSRVNELNPSPGFPGVSGQIALLPAEPESNQQKKRKQSQITDFFRA